MEEKWKLDWKDKENQRRAFETESTQPSSQGTSTLNSQANKGLRRALNLAWVDPPATVGREGIAVKANLSPFLSHLATPCPSGSPFPIRMPLQDLSLVAC